MTSTGSRSGGSGRGKPTGGDSTPTRTRRSPARLPEVRGHMRLQLMRDIAIGERSDPDLCRTYGLTARELPAFAGMYADEIVQIAQAIAGAADEQMAGLWVTKRQNRLAEIQADIDDINSAIDELREDGGKLILSFALGKSYSGLLRTKLGALKAAAEEIDGPRRRDDPEAKNAVHYVIEADDFTGKLS